MGSIPGRAEQPTRDMNDGIGPGVDILGPYLSLGAGDAR
jgi:hypothetical protein